MPIAPNVFAELKDVSIRPERLYKNPPIQDFKLGYDGEHQLPVFIEPHKCVTRGHSYEEFDNAGFRPIMIIPNNCDKVTDNPRVWINCHNLSRFIKLTDSLLNDTELKEGSVYQFYINMTEEYDVTDIASAIINKKVAARNRTNNPFNIEVMVGPVCSPDIYMALALHECDYCALYSKPAPDSPVAYPMVNLIMHTFRVKDSEDFKTKIVACGIKNLTDGIKAFGLGADYIMLDSELTISCYESNAAWDIIPSELNYLFTDKHYTDPDGYHTESARERIATSPNPAYKTLYRSLGLPAIIQTNSKHSPIPCRMTVKRLASDFNKMLRHTLKHLNKASLYEMVGECEVVITK